VEKEKSTDADRQDILRKRIVRQLQTFSDPMTTAELIHELTVLRHSGAADLPQINETSVYAALEDLMIAGKVNEAPAGVWNHVQPGMNQPKQQQLRLG
jgi:hypothetical protein